MIDSVSIVAIITACSALLVAVLTHLKHSTCNKQGFEITTTESHTPPVNTPVQTFNDIIVSVSRPPSPAILKQDLENPARKSAARKVSDPIPIPKVEIKKNYL